MNLENRLDLFEIVMAFNSRDTQARQEAYDTLVGLGDDAVEPLLEMFPDVSGTARIEIIKALGEIGDERATPLLERVVRSEDPNEILFATSMAAKSLGKLGAVETLTELLHDERVALRRMAATVLRHIEADEAVDALGRALEDDDDTVVTLSVRALRSIGTPHAIALLDQHKNG
jgi:HEAT repeat protein